MKKRKNVIVMLLSTLLSIFLIVGNSFKKKGSFEFITNHLIIHTVTFLILIFIFYKVISFLFKKLDNIKWKESQEFNKIIKIFNEHPFLFCFVIILICWLPYIISFYPAILSPDPSYQIMQFFHIDNKYSTYSILLDPSVIITNHHPVIHTLLLGSMVKIGTLLGSVNIGLFLYSIIQILILSSTLSYTIVFLKNIKTPTKYLLLCLIIYALTPVFPFYSMSAVKDVIFGSLIILYIISIYQFMNKKEITFKDMLKELLLMILIILFRNNGFHVILLSFPFLLFYKNKKQILMIFLLMLTFNITYNKVILPYFKITPSSIREVLSIPFQQTARYVNEYDSELSGKDKKIINQILEYDTLATRYNPELADPVKNKFNRYYKSEDLKEYFKVWKKGLFKHPITYIEATVHNTYGYFYPFKTNWYFYHKYDTRIVKKGFDYHYNSLSSERNFLMIIATIFPYIPVIGFLVNIGFNSWILLFMACYLIYQKKYKSLVVLLPSFVLLLVCVASPANTYFRYALPNIFAMPLLFGIFLKDCETKKM